MASVLTHWGFFMAKQKSYLDIGFNKYLTRNEDLDERIKIDKVIEEQANQQLSRISREIAQIKKEIYEGIIPNKGITNEAKKTLLDTKLVQLERLLEQEHNITGVAYPQKIGLVIAEISQLKEGLKNEPELIPPIDNIIEPKRLPYALELVYSGTRLLIKGFIIQTQITLVSHQSKSSGLLLDPIFKACKAQPTRWHKLTKHEIKSRMKYEKQSEVDAMLKNSLQFRKYLSNVGLKDPIKKLFVAGAQTDFGIKFRLAIPSEEWDSLSVINQAEVVKYLTEKAS